MNMCQTHMATDISCTTSNTDTGSTGTYAYNTDICSTGTHEDTTITEWKVLQYPVSDSFVFPTDQIFRRCDRCDSRNVPHYPYSSSICLRCGFNHYVTKEGNPTA